MTNLKKINMPKEDYMFLNNQNIGISQIEFNKDNLIITDKRGKYSLHVTISYDWDKLNKINIHEEKDIFFNEYYLSEYNESVLIWPISSTVSKPSKDELLFSFEFTDVEKSPNTCYMNKRGCFAISITSLKASAIINLQEALQAKIIYNFKNC